MKLRSIALTLLSCLFCLVCVPLASAQADTDESKEIEQRFTQLMAGGERKELPWHVDVSKPRLADFQRLEVHIWVRVPLRDLARRGPRHKLLLIAGVSDSTGRWLPSGGTYIRQTLERIPSGAREMQLGLLAFVLPGEYGLGLVLCDDPDGLCNVARRPLRVKPLGRDPLPDLWKELPTVEFLGPSESDEDKVVSGLHLQASPSQPVRVEVVANLSGSERVPYWINAACLSESDLARLKLTQGELGGVGIGFPPYCTDIPASKRVPGSYGSRYSTPESVLYALRVLGQLRVSSGSLHVTGVETTRRRVLFRQDVDKGLDWPRARDALNSVNPDMIDLVDLQDRKKNAAFFREVLAERLATDGNGVAPGGGATPRPKRVLIVLTGETIFARGADREPLRLKGDCDCRVYYLRFESTWDAWDELGRVLSSLQPRRFVVRGPEDFRKALAEILRDLGRL